MAHVDLLTLKNHLCDSMCAQIDLKERPDGLIAVTTPFTFADGDRYALFLRRLPGGFRVTDLGLTLMHMSYEMDVSRLEDGPREPIFHQALAQHGVSQDGGELYIETPAKELGAALFRIGQALTQVHDITYLKRNRATQTFYEDVRKALEQLLGPGMQPNYEVPDLPKAKLYRVDYCVPPRHAPAPPAYLFAIMGQGKAREVNVTLEHLRRYGQDFNSLLIFSDFQNISRDDIERLSNAADGMVSIDAADDLKRKVTKLAA